MAFCAWRAKAPPTQRPQAFFPAKRISFGPPFQWETPENKCLSSPAYKPAGLSGSFGAQSSSPLPLTGYQVTGLPGHRNTGISSSNELFPWRGGEPAPSGRCWWTFSSGSHAPSFYGAFWADRFSACRKPSFQALKLWKHRAKGKTASSSSLLKRSNIQMPFFPAF